MDVNSAPVPLRSCPLVIVLVVPRFHTNLYFVVRALVAAGHKVQLICARSDGIEDHSVVRPIYPNLSVSPLAAYKLLRELSPDLLIIRKVKGLSGSFFLTGLLRGIRVVGYDQQPYFRRRSCWKLASEFFGGRPVMRLTPVLGLNRYGPPDRLAAYIPFPVERPVARERQYAPGGVVRILCVGKAFTATKATSIVDRSLERRPAMRAGLV
jgi:hypothetical protein